MSGISDSCGSVPPRLYALHASHWFAALSEWASHRRGYRLWLPSAPCRAAERQVGECILGVLLALASMDDVVIMGVRSMEIVG